MFQNASPDVVKVLAGNKCDATTQRAVEAERGEKVRLVTFTFQVYMMLWYSSFINILLIIKHIQTCRIIFNVTQFYCSFMRMISLDPLFLRRIFGPKSDENGECRWLYNEQLHSLYHCTNIVRVIQSRRLICAGHLARME